jgi:hypothetical protein
VKVMLGGSELPERRFTVRLLWEPRDIWLGVFWNRVRAGDYADRFLLVYVCVIPCLPLALAWRTTCPAVKPGIPNPDFLAGQEPPE